MFRRACLIALVSSSALCIVPSAHAVRADARLNPEAIAIELSSAPDDPLLNYLIGLAYEGSTTASTEAYELARVGYIMALRQDSGFWRAAYQLGLMALDERDAFAAERYFLSAALNAPREPRVFGALARAAYCAGDIDLAAAAFSRAQALGSTNNDDDQLTAALLAAARADHDGVNGAADDLPPLLQEALLNRLAAPRETLAVAPETPAPSEEGATGPKRMAVVDVVIIRRSEANSSRSGINLLDSLSLQLGGTLINRTWSRTRDEVDPSLSTRTIATESDLLLTVPAVTYSLNLANARGNSSRIEARPTLLIYDQAEAKIFDGGSLTFATDGQLTSSSETRDIGLSLSVKPSFLDDATVNLTVMVTLETFVPSQPVGTFRQAIQTEKSSTEIAADVRFGQTMLVSGGSSREVTRNQSRTPVIGKIPLIRNLFGTKSTGQLTDELLVLLSLRRAPGQMSPRISADEQRTVSDLRDRVFPNLAEQVRLTPETRQMFYQLENPARTHTAEYLAPLLPEKRLKQFSGRR